jgi:hypothetical protein
MVLVALLISPVACAQVDGKAPDAREKTKVFILAGQSNMDGRADPRNLPKEFRGSPKTVRMLYRGEWRPLAARRGHFGPEISFGHAMAKAWPGQKIKIVKLAVGGTSLAQWMPGIKYHPDRPPLYGQLMELVKQAKADPNVEIAGVLWLQGEAEARWGGGHAKGYFGRLKRFVAQLRKDLDDDRAPFVLGRVNPPKRKYTWVDTVRAAQEKAAREIPNTAMVDCDGAEKRGDHLHYNTAGQIELGKRFSQAYLMLIAEPAERQPATE